MNRRERRVATKSAANSPGAVSGTASLLGLAESYCREGRLGEADAIYARFLATEPRHALALHMRGRIALQQGRPGDAIAHFTGAAAIAPTVAAIHDGLAESCRSIGQLAEAERHYRRVSELRPGAVTFLNLGNILLELQRPQDAVSAYESALRLDARLPEALYGIGTALAALNRDEAADAFGRAIALRPDFALAHEGLIDMCLAADASEAALQTACQALLHADTPRLRVQFIDSVLGMPPDAEAPGLRDIFGRALDERWTRPQDLAAAACRIAARTLPFDAQDKLLGRMLRLAPVCHRDIERALTGQRRTILQTAVSGGTLEPGMFAAACGLARQCFINEYAWNCTPSELAQVGHLRGNAETDLAGGIAPPDTMLAVLAMYLPLGSLKGAGDMPARERPPEVAALLAQQIAEPAEEVRLRGTIPCATPIDDDVSQAVRRQYEENPYPRWVAATGAAHRVRLGDWLAARFPDAAPAPLPGGKVLDILVAGCGTGQQAIETTRGLADVRLLAIDLSLASLAYASRMTTALGVEGIDYMQADLLQSARLGRSFDMIAAGGVLHHLADPWEGWRRLLGLLRPGGIMNVLLYTVRGRGDVRIARDWIAGRGYQATPDGIRACRQDLLALQDDWALRLSGSPDFWSISGCRDLLFHVQEQAVTLPAVSAFLAAEGIDLLGVEVPAHTERLFRGWARESGPDPMRDLARWDLFEAEHPRCFAGMLNLWVRKSSASPA